MIQSYSAPPVAESDVETRVVKSGKPSWRLWVPYIWLLFASTRALSAWLNSAKPDGTFDPEMSGSPVDRALMTVLIVLGLWVLGSRSKRTKEILFSNKWVIALFAYMALSVIWSNFPLISLRRCIRSMGTLVMVLVVLTEQSPRQAVRTLLTRLYLIILPFSVVAIKYVRTIGVGYNWNGREEEWIGLTTDKNSLGQIAMCGGLFGSWKILQKWSKKEVIVDLLLLAMAVWLLRGSKDAHSSTAIIGFIVSGAILLALQYVKRRVTRAKRIILLGTLSVIMLTPLVYLSFQAFDTTPVDIVLTATGRDMTFTDRTLLWTDIVNNAAKSPLVGVGMGAFWVGPSGYAIYPLPNWSRKTPSWRPAQGHNGYLDVYVELGAVGVTLLLIIIGTGFLGALNELQNDFQFGSLRLVLLLSIVMNNITETSFLKGTHDLWFLFLLVAVNVPQRSRKVQFKQNGTALGGLSTSVGKFNQRHTDNLTVQNLI